MNAFFGGGGGGGPNIDNDKPIILDTDDECERMVKEFYIVHPKSAFFSGKPRREAERKWKELNPTQTDQQCISAIRYIATKVRNVVICPQRTPNEYVKRQKGDFNSKSAVELKIRNDRCNPINNPINNKKRQEENETKNLVIMREAIIRGDLSEKPLDRTSAKSVVTEILAKNWRDLCPDLEEKTKFTVEPTVISVHDLITVYPQVTHVLYPVHYNPNLSPNPIPIHIKGLPLYWLHRKRNLRRGVLWISHTERHESGSDSVEEW